MAEQEFLASYAVDIDEAGVRNLRQTLRDNRDLAKEVSSAFAGATEALRDFLREAAQALPSLFPSTAGHGVTTETLFGSAAGLQLGLNTDKARKDLQAFLDAAKKPVPLFANTSAITAAARSALEAVRSILSAPVTLNVNTNTYTGGSGNGGTVGGAFFRMSAGGRFSRPTNVQVAEDGDAEYIIPVRKEGRALPLLRQLLGELSPAARKSLLGASLPAGIPAGHPAVTKNQTVSAPVNIHVHAGSGNAETIGETIYDTAEKYLLRTLRGVM